MLPIKGFGTKPNGAQFSFQQMGVLDQTLQPVDQSVLSQQLDMPQVDLPPEDSTDLSRLVPELDLLDDKNKEKDKDDSDEEVRCLLFVCCFDFAITMEAYSHLWKKTIQSGL